MSALRCFLGCIVLFVYCLLPAQALTLDVDNSSLSSVLGLLSAESNVNIIAEKTVRDERITLHLRNVSVIQALQAIGDAYHLIARRSGAAMIVGPSIVIRTAAFPIRSGNTLDIAKALQSHLPEGTVVLWDTAETKIVVSGSEEAIDRAQALVGALGVGSDLASGPKSSTFQLRYLAAKDVVDTLKTAIPAGKFLADDSHSRVIIVGDNRVKDAADRFLRTLDVPAQQVLFEVRVADVQPVNDQSDIGISFGGSYAVTKSSIAINARINAMVSSGHAKILATPKLMTLNNHEADLLIGETYPVVYYDARVGSQQVQFIDVGVKLRLTPQIGEDGSVTAEMHPEYSAIESFVGGYPVIANRKVDSTLRVQDSETIVLGGLLRDVDMETLTKLPGLGDIPILGKLFQDRARSHERDEIVFLITPHILSTGFPVHRRRFQEVQP